MPVKFRCFQCNQVLKAGRGKVGTVVVCPKCGVDLLVPEPPPEQPEPMRTEPEIPALGSLPDQGEPGWNMPAIQLRARPEEPKHSAKARALPVEPVEPAGGSSLEAFGFLAQAGEPAPPPAAPPQPTAPAEAVRPQPPFVSSGSETEIPSLNIEPPPIVSPRRSASVEDYVAPRARDVLIPRAALVGWSLFALFALVLAFVAGLLAGHFVWVVKVIPR